MNNNIIDSFCESDLREVIRKDENKINYTFFLSFFTSFKAFKVLY